MGSACEKGGAWLRALELLSTMLSDYMKIDAIVCSAVFSACDKSGAWMKVMELLRIMVQCNADVSAVMYSIAVSSCEKLREFQAGISHPFALDFLYVPSLPEERATVFVYR